MWSHMCMRYVLQGLPAPDCGTETLGRLGRPEAAWATKTKLGHISSHQPTTTSQAHDKVEYW